METSVFKMDQERLLSQMVTNQAPIGQWPVGCYGSRLAWLTFVGPSPGGGDGNDAEVPRQEQAHTPLWNQEYTEPCTSWSIGFRKSMQVLVETIMKRKKEEGALKLYNFTNFDWMQNPKAENVPNERMRRGSGTVLNHLAEVRPRVIIPMESKTHQLLKEKMEDEYTLKPLRYSQVKILIGNRKNGPSFHREMDAYRLEGAGPLADRYVIRCPQHPARILNTEYASRISRAIRSSLEAMAEGQTEVSIQEI